jgi:hypothetical protein
MKNNEKPNPNDIITLCKFCADDYYHSSDFHIRAVYPRAHKEKCTKCGRGGYDYEVTPIKNKKEYRQI